MNTNGLTEVIKGIEERLNFTVGNPLYTVIKDYDNNNGTRFDVEELNEITIEVDTVTGDTSINYSSDNSSVELCEKHTISKLTCEVVRNAQNKEVCLEDYFCFDWRSACNMQELAEMYHKLGEAKNEILEKDRTLAKINIEIADFEKELDG